MKIKDFFQLPLFGAIFMAAGFLSLFAFGRTSTLVCTRAGGGPAACSLEVKVLGMLSRGAESFRGLQGASVEESCDSDGCTYRVNLETAQGSVPVTNYYSSGYNAKQKLADQITRFAQAPAEERLELHTGDLLFAGLFSAVFILTGAAIVFWGVRQAYFGRG